MKHFIGCLLAWLMRSVCFVFGVTFCTALPVLMIMEDICLWKTISGIVANLFIGYLFFMISFTRA